MSNESSMKEFIEDVVKKAGRAVLELYEKEVGVKYTKEHALDVVTEADLAANTILTEAITARYPDHGIVSEEESAHGSDAPYVWYIDPLDGTLNFATHVPLFGVMVALAKENELTHAAVYLPVFDEFVYAQKGEGVYLNGRRCVCDEDKAWEQTYGFLDSGMTPKTRGVVRAFLDKTDGRVSYNCWKSIAASVRYMVDGKRDWCVSASGSVWDYAPPALIAREAGYRVTSLSGDEWQLTDGNQVIARPHIHERLMEILG